MSDTARQKQRQQEKRDLAKASFHPDTESIIKNAVSEFTGTGTTLESAIGAFIVGQTHGWRVLRLIHGSTTYNKYEKILGIRFSDYCPEEGILACRSMGLRIAKKLNSFWKVATRKIDTGGQTKEFDDGSKDPNLP